MEPIVYERFITIINNIVGDDKWIITGASAIIAWAKICNIHVPDNITTNNIDIFYLHNTLITVKSINNFTRKQESPCSSVTYTNPNYKDINLTLKRTSTKYIDFHGFKLMAPTTLKLYYEEENDDFEESPTSKIKYDIIQEIISQMPQLPIKTMYLNYSEPLISNEPCAKQLFVSN